LKCCLRLGGEAYFGLAGLRADVFFSGASACTAIEAAPIAPVAVALMPLTTLEVIDFSARAFDAPLLPVLA